MLFPGALIACISADRAPNADELKSVARHIWHDAFKSGTSDEWEGLACDDPRRPMVLRAAYEAICGHHTLSALQGCHAGRWSLAGLANLASRSNDCIIADDHVPARYDPARRIGLRAQEHEALR